MQLEAGSEPSFAQYRQHLAADIIRFSLPLGLFILLPSVAMALARNDVLVILVESAAYAVVLVLRALLHRIGALTQSIACVVLPALMGTLLLAVSGISTGGPAWLSVAAILATIFFGLGGGLAFCGFELLALASTAVFFSLGGKPDLAAEVISSNIATLGLSILGSLALGKLIGNIGRSLESRQRLAKELAQSKLDLEQASARKQTAEEKAEYLSSHDPLTGLPNLDSFEGSLRKALDISAARGRILGVMSIGIDRFKRIGESHGGSASEAVLAETAARLRRTFRDDDLIARSSEEGFLVLLADIKSPDDATSIIDKTNRAFDRSFSIPGAEIGLSASFGIALYPSDSRDPRELIKQSEVALHSAQADCPGCFRLYDPVLHARLIEESRIEHEIRSAILADAFLPWFQPKVDRLGRIVGVEALARWMMPQGQLRQPSQFIKAAESSGFIRDLGRSVLLKACASAAAWDRAGLQPIPVSVNLSPYQFRSDDVVKDVRSILISTGLQPSRLDLEITESGIMDDSSNAIEKLAELKSLGCSISIDDFGTGYSSFSALRDFPVDCVKLPQPFVDPLPEDPRAAAIAEAVIDLAHQLSFMVVAEGVEKPEQFSWLGRAHCDQYQGFLFSKPLPETEFCTALAAGSL